MTSSAPSTSYKLRCIDLSDYWSKVVCDLIVKNLVSIIILV